MFQWGRFSRLHLGWVEDSCWRGTGRLCSRPALGISCVLSFGKRDIYLIYVMNLYGPGKVVKRMIFVYWKLNVQIILFSIHYLLFHADREIKQIMGVELFLQSLQTRIMRAIVSRTPWKTFRTAET